MHLCISYTACVSLTFHEERTFFHRFCPGGSRHQAGEQGQGPLSAVTRDANYRRALGHTTSSAKTRRVPQPSDERRRPRGGPLPGTRPEPPRWAGNADEPTLAGPAAAPPPDSALPRPRFPLRAAGPRRHPPRPGGGRGFAPPPTKRGPAPPPPTAAPRPRGDAQLPSGFHSGCEQALRPGAGRVLDAGWRARGRAAAAAPSDSKTPSDRARPRARPAARPAAIFSSRPAAGARTGRRAPGELGRDGGREPRGGEVGPG